MLIIQMKVATEMILLNMKFSNIFFLLWGTSMFCNSIEPVNKVSKNCVYITGQKLQTNLFLPVRKLIIISSYAAINHYLNLSIFFFPLETTSIT